MNRMGVFIFYDVSGIVDEYVEVLLNSLQEVLQKLIIIVNGRIRDEDYGKLKVYSKEIFIRDNIGFDAGGYKDAFTKFIPENELEFWDEIVLFNDTFYGPIYPWKDLFSKMDKEDIDFWGLSRCSGEMIEDKIIPPHIQSFFLVCRKSLITSESWKKFWSGLEYPKILQEAVLNFEINFSVFFIQKGFKSRALTDNSEKEYVGNPYLKYPYELIRDIRFPIMKRKLVLLRYFKSVKTIFNYIISNTGYDINLIYSHIKRLQMEGVYNIFYPFNEHDIESFYNVHKRVYIYGHGNYGQGMAVYFEYKGWKYEGFLVTEKTENDDKVDNVFVYNNMNFNKADGIILALGKKAFNEVYPIVKSKLEVSQLLLPQIK